MPAILRPDARSSPTAGVNTQAPQRTSGSPQESAKNHRFPAGIGLASDVLAEGAMFDLVAGTAYRPFRDKHPGATAISIASHVVVLGIATVGTLFFVQDQFPEVPALMAFVADMPAPTPPPPPPPPLPAAQQHRETAPPKPAPSDGPTFTAPAEIPTGIQPESRIDSGGEGGVVGGVEGGLPGGVVGGVPGGIVTDVAPPPPSPKKPVRIGGNIQQPALINRVSPVYPLIAVRAKVTGTVILEATVNEAGEVTNVVVIRSVPLLDRSAVDAIKQWRYAPLLMNGAPSPFILEVTLTFSLK